MMAQQILIALGAGLATALLASSLLTATPIAFTLFLLTPLPIALAGLGWGSATGAVAAVIAATGVAAASTPLAGFVLLILFAGPMAWLAHLAGLSRRDEATPDQAEWYPLGRILMHGVGLVAVGVVLVGMIVGYDPARTTADLTEAIHAFLTQAYGSADAPSLEESRGLATLYVSILPYSLAGMNLLTLVFCLWLAGRIARVSGRLARPWAPIWTVELPPLAAAVAVISIAVAVFSPGGIALVAAPLAGASGLALIVLGLAVVHAVTFGRAGRTGLLVATYFVAIALSLFPALAIIGIVEILSGIRRRLPNQPTV